MNTATIMGNLTEGDEDNDGKCDAGKYCRGSLNSNVIKIYRTYCTDADAACSSDESKSNHEGRDNALSADEVAVTTNNNKSFTFAPKNWLGERNKEIWYSIYLDSGLQKENGDKAFGLSGYYEWKFATNGMLDLTPPKVTSVIPIHQDNAQFNSCVEACCADKDCSSQDISSKCRTDCGAWPRNIIVQINFSEAVDPTTVGGQANESKIQIKNGDNLVQGTYKIANQYKTVEFITNDLCGTNSCGDNVYCLPGNANLTGIVQAATLKNCSTSDNCPSDYSECVVTDKTNPDNHACKKPNTNEFYPLSESDDGVVDTCGNSLDGNSVDNPGPNKLGGDGVAQGPPSAAAPKNPDNFYWQFFTNNTVDLTSPKIISVKPTVGEEGVVLNKLIEIEFDKLMMRSTLKTGCGYNNDPSLCYITIHDPNCNDGNSTFCLGYWINSYNKDSNNDGIPDGTWAQITHQRFSQGVTYSTEVSSKVMDLFQNCYQPCEGPGCPNLSSGYSCCEGEAMDVDQCP